MYTVSRLCIFYKSRLPIIGKNKKEQVIFKMFKFLYIVFNAHNVLGNTSIQSNGNENAYNILNFVHVLIVFIHERRTHKEKMLTTFLIWAHGVIHEQMLAKHCFVHKLLKKQIKIHESNLMRLISKDSIFN